MTTELYIRLVIYVIVAFLLAEAVQIPFRKISNSLLKILLFLLKTAATLFLGLALIAFDYKIIWNHEYIFAALYLVLVPDIIADIIVSIVSFLKKTAKLKYLLAGLLCILFTMYNVINMQTIRADHHEIVSPKLHNEYRLVFFADLHYGSSQSKETVDKALDEIAGQDPDYLLLVGDITDENTTREEMEYIYAKIGSLGIPTYFVYGNHDRQERSIAKYGKQNYSEKELADAITNNGIVILYEEYVRINDDLVLLGREDPSHPQQRKAVKELPERPRGAYVISLDHTPYQNEETVELKADLQFSGHTHAAQFFPIQTIYRLLGLNTCGDYQIGETHLYVTPGIAGWALPLRSEAHCCYEIFDLHPEN